MTIQTLLTSLKEKATFLSTVASIIASVGGGFVYLNNNYAHAEDVKDILVTQQKLIKMQNVSQRQQMLFQVEYYDDRIRNLTAELDNAENAKVKSGRSITAIRSDLEDTKKRRELARSTLTAE